MGSWATCQNTWALGLIILQPNADIGRMPLLLVKINRACRVLSRGNTPSAEGISRSIAYEIEVIPDLPVPQFPHLSSSVNGH